MRVHSVRRNAVRCVWFEPEAKNFGYFCPSLLVVVESARGVDAVQYD
jgi:hypothetical protein